MRLKSFPRSDRPARKLTHLRLMTLWMVAPLSLSSNAQGLVDFYRGALENDPKFQSARFEKIAGEEFEAIGRAGLMPSVAASYNYSKNNADRTINGISVDRPQYDSKVTALTVRQPLFNLDAWQRYKGGQSQASFSDAKLAADAQDLIIRLATAYLDVLLAEDQLKLSIAQRDAYYENQLVNQQLFEKGAGTRTDVLETSARFELAQALVVEAQDNVANLRNELGVIVGKDPGVLDALVGTLPELPLAPTTLAEWEQLARDRNPEVMTQRHTVDYLRAEIERNRAGHYPRVDLVASHSRNTAESLLTYNQESTVNAIGVQLSLPIYSGGSVNAQTRQAAARLAGGQADMDAALKKVLVDVRKQFQLVTSTRKRISAMEQAERSAAEAVEATRKSVAGGHRVNLDVLTALQQLYLTRRDLSEARHGYLLSYLRLHAAAGLLDGEGLVKMASCFRPGS